MKIKKTIAAAFTALVLTSLAGTALSETTGAGTDFIKSLKPLSFKRKVPSAKDYVINNSAFFSASGREWDKNEMTSSGFFLNIGIFIPTKTYLSPNKHAANFDLGYDFELGNYFRLAKLGGAAGIGLRATWFSTSFTHYTLYDLHSYATSFSIVRVGPQLGFALNARMAIDAFYQLGYDYTLGFTSIQGETLISSFAGLTQELGVAFRYKVFSLGFGYRFGKLKNIGNKGPAGAPPIEKDSRKYGFGSTRITLGFKF